MVRLCHTHYSSVCQPAFGQPLEPKLEAPILAVVATSELPKGETKEKAEGWRHATHAPVSIVSVKGDHLGVMLPGRDVDASGNTSLTTPLFDVLLDDMFGRDRATLAAASQPRL
mmetsp:Transcript_28189/g.56823  ORF Transcript_28189/g.56823 Transcript_28189/m.56823 type:complete len:114 (-) Transcript_28189:320-661(-)